jgi:hypothetical protein
MKLNNPGFRQDLISAIRKHYYILTQVQVTTYLPVLKILLTFACHSLDNLFKNTGKNIGTLDLFLFLIHPAIVLK